MCVGVYGERNSRKIVNGRGTISEFICTVLEVSRFAVRGTVLLEDVKAGRGFIMLDEDQLGGRGSYKQGVYI